MIIGGGWTLVLPVFVIYENPSDFPGRFVVRVQRVSNGFVVPARDLLANCSDLAEARRCLPPGLVRMPRHPEDDPVIVETWI
jgi:hypothetical protein